MIPKSKAPKLIRFPEIPKGFITKKVASKDKGIVIAVIIAALTFPIKRKRITITKVAPKTKLCSTVESVAFTKSERL
ncbi:hypothetical protein D3C87_1984820 [compost metagenome]